MGRARSQAVRSQRLTAETRVQSRTISYGISGRQRVTVTFLAEYLVFPCHSTDTVYSIYLSPKL